MKHKRSIGIALILALGVLGAGCGGGNNDDDNDTGALAATLTGGSQRTFNLTTIRGNANFEGNSLDQPCPIRLNDLNNSTRFFECGASDTATVRSDGTFTYRGTGETWTLNGNTMTLDYGSRFGVQTASVTVESETAPRRLRLRQLTRVVNGVRNTNEDGSEIVLVEAVTP